LVLVYFNNKVAFFVLPIIGTIAFDPLTLASTNPALVYEVAGHALGHALYDHISRLGKRRGLSRREMRKIVNRKRRWFVDNIIMHHQRIHNKNRQTLVSNARSRAIERKKGKPNNFNEIIKNKESQQRQHPFKNREDDYYDYTENNTNEDNKNYSKQHQENYQEKGLVIRSRLDAKKIRARTRWLTLLAEKNN